MEGLISPGVVLTTITITASTYQFLRQFYTYLSRFLIAACSKTRSLSGCFWCFGLK